MNAVDKAWGAVIVALQQAYNGRPELGCVTDEDDYAMRSAGADDLIAWVDDLEARVGLDTDALRYAMHEYLDARGVA